MSEPEKKVARREFFTVGFSRMRASAAGMLETLVESKIRRRHIRPPGAAGELEFLSRCTKCEDCIQACPHDAIVHLPASAGPAAFTPAIQPTKSPCRLCKEVACATACTTGALRPVLQKNVKIASIRFDRGACYAWTSMPCDYCHKWCPLKDQAITLDEESRPIFDDRVCSGCGACLKECPAKPAPLSLTPL